MLITGDAFNGNQMYSKFESIQQSFVVGRKFVFIQQDIVLNVRVQGCQIWLSNEKIINKS
jgi:hypothetical protein